MSRIWIAVGCLALALGPAASGRTMEADSPPARDRRGDSGPLDRPPARSPATASAPAAPHGSGRIELAGCSVKLIDEVELAGERPGILDFVVLEGTAVRAGDLVARTRDRLVRAALAVAEKQASNDIEIRYTRKASEQALLEYDRSLAANQSVAGTVPDVKLREQRLAAEKSLLQIEQAEHTLAVERLKAEEAREALAAHRVEAPFDAVVRKVHKKRGEAVREGEPIVELVNTARMRVDGYLPLRELPHVQVGSHVEVRLEGDDLEPGTESLAFAGRVAFIDVKVVPLSNTVRVQAEVANRGGALREGLNATMRIDPERVDRDFAAQRTARRDTDR